MLNWESRGELMIINGVDLEEYGAMVTDEYNVGVSSVQSGFNMGGSSTMPVGYSIEVKEKSFEIPIAFVASSTLEALEKKSKMLSTLCDGTVEIYDDENDVYYSAVFTSISSESILMPGAYKIVLEFRGVMHGELISFIQTEAFIPLGYAKNGQDCRLSTTVNNLESDGTFKIAGITFESGKVSVGTEIVIDGFTKIVYVNGAPGIAFCDIISFPKLYPGKETLIECKDPVKIEYYPVYK